jgi:virginiamycin B lyase
MKPMIPIVSAFICALAGSAFAGQASFYQLPSGAFPHDVAPAPDGTVWYSDQAEGFLGLLDPKTGKTQNVRLGPGAAPHGVIIGPDGAPWVTEGGQNAIARVDPATHAVKLFPLPRQFADANLNTATFDKKGVLWFTGQSGVHGRLDPAVGKVEAWHSPRPGSYGMTTTPGGDVWFASLAGNFIGKVDSTTGAVAMVEPPRPSSGPRRIWSDSHGMLWVSLWNSGGVGRYDPAAKSWKIYAMPKSRSGTYAVYVDDKDRVWATDWLANAIQRFDQETESFVTFPSDKRGAEIRQLNGRPGETWGGESGNNRLVVIRD